MNLSIYELLIPQGTLLLGLFSALGIWVWGDSKTAAYFDRIHVATLLLAFLQQCLLYRMPATTYLRGGMALDGLTQISSIIILAVALFCYALRTKENHPLSIYTGSLFLLSTLFAINAVQTNRFMFGALALIGFVWSAQGALAEDGLRVQQARTVQSGLVRSLVLILPLTLLVFLCLGLFGETEIDDIQRSLFRPGFSKEGLRYLQILVVFISALVAGFPPFVGLLGSSRRYASWGLSVGLSLILGLTGAHVAVRWGQMLFSRPSLGGFEMEMLASANFYPHLQIMIVAALVLIPIMALANLELKTSFLVFLLNPIAQSLLGISMGNRELIGFGVAQWVATSLAVIIATGALIKLEVGPRTSLREWVGVGRRDLEHSSQFLLAIWALAGFLPFFGGVLNMKTLNANSFVAPFLLLNILMSGLYALRLTVLAFQRSAAEGALGTSSKSKGFSVQECILGAQSMALILLGIFWQPLYKYGALSIKHFFGD